MKRKVVQHGPCTLTVSLPSHWVRRYGLRKGDEVTLDETDHVLSVSAQPRRKQPARRIRIIGLSDILVHKILSGLYKSGCDDVTIEYRGAEDVQLIHELITRRFIGYEIIEESASTITIKRVSQPYEEEIHVLLRRLFHFLLSIADDGCAAAQRHDTEACRAVILRDVHVDKITNFCMSIVHKHGQKKYPSDIALYHLIEQMEKIGDMYKDLLEHVSNADPVPAEVVALFAHANVLLREFVTLFYNFSFERANAFVAEYVRFREEALAVEERGEHARTVHLLRMIVRELYNLVSTTVILNL